MVLILTSLSRVLAPLVPRHRLNFSHEAANVAGLRASWADQTKLTGHSRDQQQVDRNDRSILSSIWSIIPFNWRYCYSISGRLREAILISIG